ncbi:uncharacterized protein LOC129591109 [Paramacrobiotus metropolitanus]|uniref:uncharacterized protein LOC129591109 n=1 Tax=Paramacrobiotus metropolitanus TaxID=2943436 RepID=UPI0024463098|nr:uncharacterized protein LOC129591109 [Paramacrobiotus metropolitanus]
MRVRLLTAAALLVIPLAECVTYVWDLLKPPLNAVQSQAALATAQPGRSYPTYSYIPATSFQCGQEKQAGYYADTETECQVFHRCDLDGVMTSYLCPNKTIFNQITLVCDFFYNVECARSSEFVDFANSRLYSNGPLFESPPADYIPPTSDADAATALKQMPPNTPATPARRPPLSPPRQPTSRPPVRPPVRGGASTAPPRGPGGRPPAGGVSRVVTTTASGPEENVIGGQRHYSMCRLYDQFKNTLCLAKPGFSTDSFQALRQTKANTTEGPVEPDATDQSEH